jgi:hypothetical protein
MKTGDVSRSRRLADPARRQWYARYRAVRFARRMRETRTLIGVCAPYGLAFGVMASGAVATI